MKFHWGDYLFGTLVAAIIYKMNPSIVIPIWMLICVGILVIVLWVLGK